MKKKGFKGELSRLAYENKILKIALIIISFIFLIFTINLYIYFTGYVTIDDFHNIKKVTADVSQEFIDEKVVFSQFFPEKCKDGIAVSDGSKDIDFEVYNEIYENGECKEAYIKFNNEIYGLSAEIEITKESGNNSINVAGTGLVVEEASSEPAVNSGTTGNAVDIGDAEAPAEIPLENTPAPEPASENPIEDATEQITTPEENQEQQTNSEQGSSSEASFEIVKVPRTITYSIYYDKTIESVKRTEYNETAILKKEETTVQGRAVIGKPVKWTKTIDVSGESNNVSVIISGDASNISVKKIENGQEINIEDKVKINEQGIIKDLKDAGSNPDGVEGSDNAITGNSIFSIFTGRAIDEQAIVQEGLADELIIEDSVSQVQVEYETPAPYAVESEKENGKEITIVSDADVHYTNVLAYTILENEVEAGKLKLYHIEGESRKITEFNESDTNNNGLIDYIEWNVPSLSNQTYELVIEISNAEHLDADKEFIEDIYSKVNTKDDNWALIPDNDYIKVIFKSKLTADRDITLYARAQENSKIEVYQEGNDNLIARFENVQLGGYYKIYLTSLEGEEDTFYLKVKGNVEFDYIVDPVGDDLTEGRGAFTSTSSLNAGCTTPPSTGNYCPAYAVDNVTTGSTTAYSFVTKANDAVWPKWWQVNLSDTYWISQVNLINSYFTTKETWITVSTDGSTWTEVGSRYTGWTGNGNSTNHTFTSVQAAYVRVNMNQTWGTLSLVGFYEFQVIQGAAANSAPTNPSPAINSTDGSNLTTQNLNCYATISDPDSNTMNVSIIWYNNSVNTLAVDYNNSYASGIFFNAILGSGNLTANDNWSCGMRLNDGQASSSWVNSSNLTVLGSSDTTYPIVNITYPLNATYNVNVSALNYTLTEANPNKCWYSNSSGAWNSTSVAPGTNWTDVNSKEGSNTWIVYCNDTTGNTNSSSVTFVKDTIYPAFSLYLDSNSSLFGTGTAWFNVTISLTNGTVFLQINNTNITAGNLTANVYNVSYTFTRNGTYSYYWGAYGSGSLHNYNVSNTQYYTILNNFEPNTTLVIVNSTTGNNMSNESINCYASLLDNEQTSLNAYYKWYKNNAPVSGFGTTTYTWTGIDGSTAASWIDGSFTSAGNMYDNDWSSLGYTQSSGNLYQNYSWNSDFLNSGGINVEQKFDTASANGNVTDYCWNYSSSLWDAFYSWQGTSLVQINNSIPSSCINTNNLVRLKIYMTRIAGSGSVRFYEQRLLYNASSTTTTTYNKTVANNTLTLLGDVGSGNLTAGDNWTCSVMASDNIANETDWNNASIAVISSDVTSPIVAITSPGSSVSNSSLSVNISLNEEGSCTYSLNAGITNNSMSANASNTGFTAVNNSIADGSYILNAYCQDLAGNKNYTASQSFTLENLFITGCATLDSANSVYNQTADIIPTTTCIKITAENITYNCQGYSISNSTSSGYGIFSNQTNTTIKNCNVSVKNIGINAAIYLDNANFSTIKDSFTSNNKIGYSLIYVYNTSIINCTSTNDAIAMSLAYSSYNLLENNTISSPTSSGIYSQGGSSYNTVNNLQRTITGEAYDLVINDTTQSFVLSDFNFRNYYIYAASGAVIKKASKGQIVFQNSFNATGSNLSSDVIIDTNYVYVNSSGTGFNSSANITLYNVPTGFVVPKIFRDGVACTDCYNFTSLNAGTVVFNVTGFSNFTIAEGNTAPSILSLIVNSTSSGNYSSGSLQCYAKGADSESSSLTAYYKWYLNNVLQADPTPGSTTVTNGTLSALGNPVTCSGYLERNQNWTCSVLISDGNLNSSWQNASITIKNMPPGTLEKCGGIGAGDGNIITLNSTDGSNKTTSSLTGSASIYDAESDSLTYEYRWAKDNVIQVGLTGTTVASASLSTGNWTFEARANDGSVWGSWITSNVVVLTGTTANTVAQTPSGGGGASAPVPSEIKADVQSINIDNNVGIIDSQSISLSNINSKPVDVKIELVNIQNIVRFENASFILQPGELLRLNYDVVTPITPGIYTGKILIKVGAKILEIPFSLNVQSKKSLFDISIDIAEESRIVNSGELLKAQITLLKAINAGKEDVTLEYIVKDYEGREYMKKSETVAVDGQKQLIVKVPTNGLVAGKYILGVEVKYSGGIATASYQFGIKERLNSSNVIFIAIIVIIIGGIAALIGLVRSYNKKLKEIRKHHESHHKKK